MIVVDHMNGRGVFCVNLSELIQPLAEKRSGPAPRTWISGSSLFYANSCESLNSLIVFRVAVNVGGVRVALL